MTLPDSEPEPDVSVARGTLRDYLEQHPLAEETALVVEISDATLQRGRATKMHIYAAANIPEYWIVNLVENQIEIYQEPPGPTERPAYRRQNTYRKGDDFAVQINNQTIATVSTDDILL